MDDFLQVGEMNSLKDMERIWGVKNKNGWFILCIGDLEGKEVQGVRTILYEVLLGEKLGGHGR